MGTVISDNMDFHGNVKINVIENKTGTIIETIENHNLIVKAGRSELIKLLAGTLGSNTGAIKQCSVGKGGADISNPFVPIAPTPADTSLIQAIRKQDVGSIVTDLASTNPRVTFTTLFNCADVNSLVNEAALWFENSTIMFARYTFKTVPLESDAGMSMEVIWTIEF